MRCLTQGEKEAREIGMSCPECGEGQVVERKGRWGRFFYGCRRYPDCKFTAYSKPIAGPCPDCGRSYLLEKETKKEGLVVFCGNEACHYKRDARPAQPERHAGSPLTLITDGIAGNDRGRRSRRLRGRVAARQARRRRSISSRCGR